MLYEETNLISQQY